MVKSLEELCEDTTWRLDIYEPWTLQGMENPARNNTTRLIMGLKTLDDGAPNWKVKQHTKAIKHYIPRLGKALNGAFGAFPALQLAIVPSSIKGQYSDGLLQVINNLTLTTNLIFDPNFLVRTQTVRKSRAGGGRSVDKHLKTIEVQTIPDPYIPLLILDDVTTTGNTLRACKTLLSDSGVHHIIMLALGQTRHT